MGKNVLLFNIDVLSESNKDALSSFQVFECANIDEAQNILHTQVIDLIICYEKTPSNKSITFLRELNDRFPKIIRILFMQIIEEKVIVKAFMSNLIKLSLCAPYTESKVTTVILRLLETEKNLKSTNIESLISNISELPTIGSIYHEVSSLIEKDSALYEISQVIEKDQSTSAKLLHLANSAFYFVKTGSVSHAISYLGSDITKQIVLASSIIDTLDVPKIAVKNTEQLWNHSFITNKLLIFFYEKILLKKLPENLLSAGLLHNIGMVFIIKYFHEKYIEFIKNKNSSVDSLELENNLFKIDHQLIGGYILSWWGFNFPIVEAALYHHTPLDENIINKELVLALHIVEHYAYNFSNKKNPNTFYEECFLLLQISRLDFEKALENFKLPY